MSEARAASPVAAIRSGSPLAYAAFIAAMLACGLYAVFIIGPSMRAKAQAELTLTIADETRGFCEKFGMRAGTAEFLNCSRELATIRERQVERDRAADQGIL
jgi:hypothetical protein